VGPCVVKLVGAEPVLDSHRGVLLDHLEPGPMPSACEDIVGQVRCGCARRLGGRRTIEPFQHEVGCHGRIQWKVCTLGLQEGQQRQRLRRTQQATAHDVQRRVNARVVDCMIVKLDWQLTPCLQSKRLLIGARWVSTPLSLAGKLRPRRRNK
jgi:hypothetical protein